MAMNASRTQNLLYRSNADINRTQGLPKIEIDT